MKTYPTFREHGHGVEVTSGELRGHIYADYTTAWRALGLNGTYHNRVR